MTVDPYSHVPIYRQIAAVLRARIASGELQPYDRLPTEMDLVGEYGVARATARHAVAVLREEGLVFTVQARGTFVVAQGKSLGRLTRLTICIATYLRPNQTHGSQRIRKRLCGCGGWGGCR